MPSTIAAPVRKNYTPSGPAAFFCLFLALASAFFCAPGAIAAARISKDSPLYAVTQVQDSIDAANSDIFNQAVDIDAVLNSGADAMLLSLRNQVEAGKVGGGNLALALALAGAAENSGQAGLVKTLLISEVKGFVATGINGGYFAGAPNGNVKPAGGSLASSLKKMPAGRREIIPGKIISKDGDKATVSAVFKDPKAGTLPLTLALEKKDGRWKVIEIANAAALVEEASRNAQK